MHKQSITYISPAKAQSVGIHAKISTILENLTRSGFTVKHLSGNTLQSIKRYLLYFGYFPKRGEVPNYIIYRSVHFANPLLIINFLYLSYLGVKVIYEIPHFPYVGEYKSRYSVRIYIDRIFSKLLFCCTHKIIFYSKGENIHRWFPYSNLVSVENFPLIFCDTNNIKNINKHSRSVNYLYLSSFQAWHQVDNVISEFINYHEICNTNSTLHIVGDGPTYNSCVNLFSHNHVIFHGRKTTIEVADLIKKVDVGIDTFSNTNRGHNDSIKLKDYLNNGLVCISQNSVSQMQYSTIVSTNNLDVNAFKAAERLSIQHNRDRVERLMKFRSKYSFQKCYFERVFND